MVYYNSRHVGSFIACAQSLYLEQRGFHDKVDQFKYYGMYNSALFLAPPGLPAILNLPTATRCSLSDPSCRYAARGQGGEERSELLIAMDDPYAFRRCSASFRRSRSGVPFLWEVRCRLFRSMTHSLDSIEDRREHNIATGLRRHI